MYSCIWDCSKKIFTCFWRRRRKNAPLSFDFQQWQILLYENVYHVIFSCCMRYGTCDRKIVQLKLKTQKKNLQKKNDTHTTNEKYTKLYLKNKCKLTQRTISNKHTNYLYQCVCVHLACMVIPTKLLKTI